MNVRHVIHSLDASLFIVQLICSTFRFKLRTNLNLVLVILKSDPFKTNINTARGNTPCPRST